MSSATLCQTFSHWLLLPWCSSPLNIYCVLAKCTVRVTDSKVRQWSLSVKFGSVSLHDIMQFCTCVFLCKYTVQWIRKYFVFVRAGTAWLLPVVRPPQWRWQGLRSQPTNIQYSNFRHLPFVISSSIKNIQGHFLTFNICWVSAGKKMSARLSPPMVGKNLSAQTSSTLKN